MITDKDKIANLYEKLIEEKITPLAVQSNATGAGETGGLKPGDLPADAASTTEVQKGTGAENAKDIPSPEEADAKLSPVSKNKGTNKTATKKTVTESDAPKKSFMDLFNFAMINEDDIESDAYDDEAGDFPEPEENVPVEDEMEEDLDEGEIYSQLSDLFGKLASIKGAELTGDEGMEPSPDEELGMDADDDIPAGADTGMGESTSEELTTLIEMRKRLAKKVMKSPNKYHKHQIDKAKKIVKDTVEEAVSKPEPEELISDISQLQAPRPLAGKGVKKSSDKKAAIKGNDKKHTGELETGPEGLKHDKSKFAVKGDGPVHKANNASFFED